MKKKKIKVLIDLLKTPTENIILGLPIIEGKTIKQLLFSLVASAIRQLEERYGTRGYQGIRPNKINNVKVVLTKSDPNYMFVIFPETLWRKTILDTHFYCFYFIQKLLDKGFYNFY